MLTTNLNGIVVASVVMIAGLMTPLGLASPVTAGKAGEDAVTARLPDDLAKAGVDITKLPKGVNKVYPGPGMPSLESLGLTSEMLFDPAYMARVRSNLTAAANTSPPLLSKRYTDQCLNSAASGRGYATNDGVAACAGYLAALGTSPCSATSNGATWCYSTNYGYVTYATGYAVNTLNGATTATSYCSDASWGVVWGIIANCYWNNQGHNILQSIAAAQGNGDLVAQNWGTYWA